MENSMLEARHEAGAYRRIEVITGGKRRQNWTATEKARIVAESLEAGANVSEVARRNGVSRGILTVWRRQARELAQPGKHFAVFAPVEVASEARSSRVGAVASEPIASSSSRLAPVIEVKIGGATIRVPAGADRATLDAVILALRGTR